MLPPTNFIGHPCPLGFPHQVCAEVDHFHLVYKTTATDLKSGISVTGDKAKSADGSVESATLAL